MSRAFTKEDDSNSSIDLGERPVSPHRNLVTENGLAMIDAEIAALHEELAKGKTGTIADEQDTRHSWAIVGEDEADASHGKISHVSPMAQLMFGKSLGDIFELNGREWEIIAIGLPQVESE